MTTDKTEQMLEVLLSACANYNLREDDFDFIGDSYLKLDNRKPLTEMDKTRVAAIYTKFIKDTKGGNSACHLQ
jgi:hypothetical protein